MNTPDAVVADGTIEECIDALDEFIGSLDRYPGPVIAHALQVHLSALLRVLVERGLCTPAQARELIADLAREAA
jgi:hypothetical protein